MRINILLLTVIVMVLTLSAGKPRSHKTPPTAGLIESVRGQHELEERIRRIENSLLPSAIIKGQLAEMRLADRLKFYQVPGVSVAVINNGGIDWARGFGVIENGGSKPITPETLFQAGSTSKAVTAMAALRLVEQGKLNLDEDVNLKLKSWKVPENEFTREQKVTLRRILTHTAGLTVSGFPGYVAGTEVPTLIQVFNGRRPARTAAIRVDTIPGVRRRYSGGGYAIMQQLLIDVTGEPFPELMRELVLTPAGMTHSTYEQPLPKGLGTSAATGHRSGQPIKGRFYTYPEMAAAGLWTTPTDLAALAIEIQKEIAGKSNKILSPKMAQEMVSKQFETWGLGLSIDGSGQGARFSHGGSNEGFETFWSAYQHTGQGVVVMTNGNRGFRVALEIMRALAREYSWPDPPTPRERTLAKLDSKLYEAYVGEYEPGIRVSVENGHLYVLGPDFSPGRIELYPDSETRFFMIDDDCEVSFERNEQGQVMKIVIRSDGGTLDAKRIKR